MMHRTVIIGELTCHDGCGAIVWQSTVEAWVVNNSAACSKPFRAAHVKVLIRSAVLHSADGEPLWSLPTAEESLPFWWHSMNSVLQKVADDTERTSAAPPTLVAEFPQQHSLLPLILSPSAQVEERTRPCRIVFQLTTRTVVHEVEETATASGEPNSDCERCMSLKGSSYSAAQRCKEEGNRSFQLKDFDVALRHYRHAIERCSQVLVSFVTHRSEIASGCTALLRDAVDLGLTAIANSAQAAASFYSVNSTASMELSRATVSKALRLCDRGMALYNEHSGLLRQGDYDKVRAVYWKLCLRRGRLLQLLEQWDEAVAALQRLYNEAAAAASTVDEAIAVELEKATLQLAASRKVTPLRKGFLA